MRKFVKCEKMGTKAPKVTPFGTQNFSLSATQQTFFSCRRAKLARKWVPNNTKAAFWYPAEAVLRTFYPNMRLKLITLF